MEPEPCGTGLHRILEEIKQPPRLGVSKECLLLRTPTSHTPATQGAAPAPGSCTSCPEQRLLDLWTTPSCSLRGCMAVSQQAQPNAGPPH